MEKLKLGIIGATGLVGQTFIKLLIEKNLLDNFELYLIASENSKDKMVYIQSKKYKIYPLNDNCLKFGLNIAVFSAGDDISKKWAKRFTEANCIVIDNTNAFRRENYVPLVVPEINGNLVKNEKLIANPNCSTIQLAVVLNKMLNVEDIEQVIVASYQSVSGAGKKAVEDLNNNTTNVFEKGIKNNFIPAIGGFSENGFCSEEDKIMFELNKILNTKITVFATTVRVPIEICHGESVYVKFKNKISLNLIEDSLNCDYIKYSKKDLFLPCFCAGTNKTYVCRLRKCSENEIMFFVVADNLRRGASYNALEIVKILTNNIK